MRCIPLQRLYLEGNPYLVPNLIITADYKFFEGVGGLCHKCVTTCQLKMAPKRIGSHNVEKSIVDIIVAVSSGNILNLVRIFRNRIFLPYLHEEKGGLLNGTEASKDRVILFKFVSTVIARYVWRWQGPLNLHG